MFHAGVLTVSDRSSQGLRTDASGPALVSALRDLGFVVDRTALVPDDVERIGRVLMDWADRDRLDLVLTTGGTGLSPRDVTPEATLPVLQRVVPGMAEAMRAASLAKTPHAMLSRALAGVRGETLIINLPGGKGGALENFAVVAPALAHAIEKIHGDPSDCAPPS